MRVLSVHSPWAYAIFHMGRNVDNRSWQAPKSIIGERILIHSTKYFDSHAAATLFSSKRRNTRELVQMLVDNKLDTIVQTGLKNYPRGCITGSVVVADCVPVSKVKGNSWAHGPYCWILEDPIELDEAIDVDRGFRKLWSIADIEISDGGRHLIKIITDDNGKRIGTLTPVDDISLFC